MKSRVSFEEFIPKIDEILQEISINQGVVGRVYNIGSNTNRIGKYFSDYFYAIHFNLPSIHRKDRDEKQVQNMNNSFEKMTKEELKDLFEDYKSLYEKSERAFPTFFESELLEDNSGLITILVDDNSYTGKTFMR